VASEYQTKVEVLYTSLLLRALHRIEEEIPPHDLAIQWDAAFEFGMLENPLGEVFIPWLCP